MSYAKLGVNSLELAANPQPLEARPMKIRIDRKVVTTALLIVLVSIALGAWAGNKYDKQNVLNDLEVFAKVIDKIQSFYVDDVDTHKLVTEAIEKMLQELDPHSQFLSGLDYEDLMLSTQGRFGGLGIYISFRDNYPTVISPIEGTPASKAGLQGGDQIVEIEGEPSEGWQVSKAVRYLRGDPGSAVSFKISRPGLEEPIEYSLVREEIKVKSIPYSGMFGDNGYVKISSFSKNTAIELEQALSDLESQGMKGLVLDLRYNPGGLLQAATAVSELFLDKDQLIVFTKGRYAQNNNKYFASKGRKFTDFPVVVMVNGASASASEIVAGALQDWDAGLVVGQTTFGKGTVQTVFSLSDSQAVKLTTAKYYTPSGRSIHSDHGQGEEAETAGADASGEELTMAETADNVEIGDADRPVFHTSGGRDVYGGGGITPDLAFEMREYGELERNLASKGMFFTFAVQHSTTHEVTKDFEVTDDIIDDFKDMLKDREFEFEDDDFSGSALDYVRRAIASEMMTKNFGRGAGYRVGLEKDQDFQRVLKIFGRAPTLQEMFTYAEQQKELKKASLR
jgi:carboxyl-terminal processing protease